MQKSFCEQQPLDPALIPVSEGSQEPGRRVSAEGSVPHQGSRELGLLLAPGPPPSLRLGLPPPALSFFFFFFYFRQ